MKGLKCFTAAAIPNDSTSHGSQFTVIRRVAPIPRLVTDPSVTIPSLSGGCSSVQDLWPDRAFGLV